MKIVKPGKHMNRQWTGEFDCTGHGNGNHGCGARLELTAEDLYQNYNSCMGRSQTWYISFMCPCCGAETDLCHTDGYRHPDFPATMDPKDFKKPARASVRASQEHLLSKGVYRHPFEFEAEVNQPHPGVAQAPSTSTEESLMKRIYEEKYALGGRDV